ncbi:reticulon-like protein B21 isoform X2 [Macadamia integrifolia]|uniref:reticulon-like protein B21 isoform X2 n=1 Tax=Macadamia integrifolia TaxID=60698 RepID=UPI001C4EA0BF|nr:reticulon-like protein B21 isoform X2 [Macadamia integrifolia]
MDFIRRSAEARKTVVAGSVWESRMKSDEVKGGIKVFNGEENSEEGGGDDQGLQFYQRLKRNQNGGATRKRRTWNDRSPFQIRKTRSELKRFSDESCKELNFSVDSIEETQILMRKSISNECCKELGVSADVTEKSPIQLRKTRSDSHRNAVEILKKLQISRENIVSPGLSYVNQVNSPQRLWMDDDGIDADGEDEGQHEEHDFEIEVDKKSYDDKEVNLAEQKSVNILEQKLKEVEEVKKVHQIPRKPIPISANVNNKLSPVIDGQVIDLTKPKKVVNEEKKVHHLKEKPKHIFSKANKHPAPVRTPLIDPSLRKPPPIAASKVFDKIPETPKKLQNIVDLVMWKDISKSIFAFGVGTFFILSSSFIAEFNFSLISGISYMGLIYLAAIFLYKSILCRGAICLDNSKNKDYMVGEEEAIWVLRQILPSLNEFLLTLRSLLSGDPATTMKLAVLLFVVARCGSSITMWTMAKLGFFAVFTVPKVCSSYSSQLTTFAKFWIRRCKDAWYLCTYKNAVSAAGFALTWIFSSVVARIWLVFMLVVAVRYYQQSLSSKDWRDEEMKRGREDFSWREGEYEGDKEKGLVGPP